MINQVDYITEFHFRNYMATSSTGKRLELRLLRYANLAMGERSQGHRVSRSCDTLDIIDNEVKNEVSLCRFVNFIYSILLLDISIIFKSR